MANNPHFDAAAHHLTLAQQDLLAAFKGSLVRADLYTAQTDNVKESHNELTLLRFLRARRFDVALAQKQFSAAEAWRKQYDVENLFATFDSNEFESSKRFYPRWTGRRDKSGLPLYVYHLASLSSIQKELDSVPRARRYHRIIALYELMIQFTMPFCTYLPHSTPIPISSVTTIIDLKDVTMTSLWMVRNHLQEASCLATANYPETLNTIAVVNSPPFFPTVWGWIKGWFDEGTRNKIHVIGSDPGPILRELVNSADLPKAYGGELEWNFEDEPNLDEAARNIISDVPQGPAIFVDGVVLKPSGIPEKSLS